MKKPGDALVFNKIRFLATGDLNDISKDLQREVGERASIQLNMQLCYKRKWVEDVHMSSSDWFGSPP